MSNEIDRYLLAERLAIRARKELEKMDLRVDQEYLTNYFDEAIGNAIHKKQRRQP